MQSNPPVRHIETLPIIERLRQMEGASICIVGDVMLDHYCIGDVLRISPEAPVPVVTVTEERHQLGGAGNVARNISHLNGSPHVFSVAGMDDSAKTLALLLKSNHISGTVLQLQDRPTTQKTRIISQHQQIVRIDREEVSYLSEKDQDALLAKISGSLSSSPIVILSDYGKGVISPSFYTKLQQMLSKFSDAKLLIDPKIRNFPFYSQPYLLTPNLKELFEGAGHYPSKDSTAIIKAGLALFKKTQTQHLLVTLGANGMALFVSPDSVYHIPTFAKDVFDVTGAGDTVISVLALGLASGLSLLESCIVANSAAGIVVGEIGAATVSRETLTMALRHQASVPVTTWLGRG